MDGDPFDTLMPWQEELFQTVPGLHEATALADSVDAAFAAPAPGAPAPAEVVNKCPPTPPTYRDWFDNQPENKAAAKKLHKDDPNAAQGLTKYQAMVWDQHAGVNRKDGDTTVTNPAVLELQIEYAEARVKHYDNKHTEFQKDPNKAALAPLIGGQLRTAMSALAAHKRAHNKMHGVVVRRGRPAGSGGGAAGAARIGGSAAGAARTGGVRFGTGRTVATPSKAGQRAPVSKSLQLAPGYARYFMPVTGKPVYVDSTFTHFSKSPLLVMPAAQRQALKAAIAEADAAAAAELAAAGARAAAGPGIVTAAVAAARAQAAAAAPRQFTITPTGSDIPAAALGDDDFAADGASDAAEAAAGGGVPLFTLPVDAAVDGASDSDDAEDDEEEEEEEEEEEGAAAAAHRAQVERYQRGYELMTEHRFSTKPAGTAAEADDDDSDEDVPAAPAARGAKRGRAPAKASAAKKRAKKAKAAAAKPSSAKRTSGAHADAPKGKRAKRT
jgi:hypothetical protein